MADGRMIGNLALLGRTIGLGLERPLIKKLGLNRDSYAATTVYFGFGELLLLPLIIYSWIMNPAYPGDIAGWIGFALLSGVIYTLAFHTYVYALSVGEVSLLAPLYATMFVWLYLLDLIYGEATFGWLPLAGILLVTFGIIALGIAPGQSLSKALNPLTVLRQPGAVPMLIYSFCLGLARLVDKGGANIDAPPVLYAFIANLPSVLFGVGVLMFRKRAMELVKLSRERFWVAFIGAFAGMYAYVLMLVALRYYNPSVVEPVTQLSVLIAVALGIWWFKEPLRARWLAALLVIAGAVLLIWKPA